MNQKRAVIRALFRLGILASLLSLTLPGSAQLASSSWAKFRGNAASNGIGGGSGSDGHIAWSFPTNADVYSSPVIGPDGTVYIYSTDGDLRSVSPSGAINWTLNVGTYCGCTPAVGQDGTIYVATEGYLAAVSPLGTVLWTANTNNFGGGFGGVLSGSVSIAQDGTILSGSGDGNLYGISTSGVIEWTFQTGGPINSTPAIGNDGTIYTGSSTGLYALTPGPGTISQKWYLSQVGDIFSAPAVTAQAIYVTSLNGNIYSISPSGVVNWTRSISGAFVSSSPAVAANGTIYSIGYDGYLNAMDPAGNTLWATSIPGDFSSPAIGSDGTIYVGSSDFYIFAVATNGSVKWAVDTGDYVSCSPAIASNGTVYIGCNNGTVYALGTPTFADTIKSLSLNPTSVVSGQTVTGTITLNKPAPTGGWTVNLTSVNTAYVTVQSTVVVPAGQTSATFTINTKAEDHGYRGDIHADDGGSHQYATLDVLADGN